MRRSFRLLVLIIGLTVFLIPFFVFAAAMGDRQNFNVSPAYDFSERKSLSATLRQIGQQAQYFVEDAYWESKSFSDQQEILQKLSKLSEEFDNRIYAQETAYWGAEPNSGIDNDAKVYILLSNLVSTAGGYYDTSNQYSKSDVPDSNEKEIIFLNMRVLLNSDQRVYGFLAHEFQHLITFNQKNILRDVNEDIWLNEVRSEYASTHLGYNDVYNGSNLQRRAAAFLAEPTDSLTEWENQSKDYGQVALFGEYLAEHYGDILAEALKSNRAGIDSLNEALQKKNFSLSFGDIYLRWAVANSLNDTFLDSTYGYTKESLRQEIRAAPTQVIASLGDGSESNINHEFKDWQTKWFWVTGFLTGQKNWLQVDFSGPKKRWFKVAAVTFYQSGKREVKFFDLNDNSLESHVFFDLKDGVEKIILAPVKMEKNSGFGEREELSSFRINVKRVADPSNLSQAREASPSPPGTLQATPADYGLKEGDFIRAEGDHNVYIINDFGFKRLILNPKICLQYGHLGQRGCFSAVKMVSPAVRDAFRTSWYAANGETKDGKVYWLEETGEDTAVLHHLNLSGDQFISQGGIFKSVFLINSLEQKSYPAGAAVTNLSTRQ